MGRIAFVSTNGAGPWGGSEVLWSEAALRLARQGHAATASVSGWPSPSEALQTLRTAGVDVHERAYAPPNLRPSPAQKLVGAIIRRTASVMLNRWLEQVKPDLICVSMGSPDDDVALASACMKVGVPYTIVLQANGEHIWPDDAKADRLVEFFTGAARAYFVSGRNRSLLEAQIGANLKNAEIVRNPFNVRWDAAPEWPMHDEPVRLACIARLEPKAKGQDLLLRVLAREPWRSRPISLSLYGSGPMERSLKRLCQQLDLADRVAFCGYANDIEKIWAEHHALVLPSRFEGLPLAVVEAMLCGRPAIVTDVADSAEFITEGQSGFVAEAPTLQHLDLALERAWERRGDWREIGRTAAVQIRGRIPKDPASELADSLLHVLHPSASESNPRVATASSPLVI